MRRTIGWLSLGVVWVSGATATAATIQAETPVKVRLLSDVRSGHIRKGEHIFFEVIDPVVGADGKALIPRGTPVVGTIKKSKRAGLFGRPGKLEFTIDYVKLSDQVQVPMKLQKTRREGKDNSFAADMGAVLFGPMMWFVSGKEAKIEAGKEFAALVDHAVDVPDPAPAVVAATVVPRPPFIFDPKRTSIIKFKSGETLTGTIWEFKDCSYTVATENGEMVIPQDKIDTISGATEQKAVDPLPADEKKG